MLAPVVVERKPNSERRGRRTNLQQIIDLRPSAFQSYANHHTAISTLLGCHHKDNMRAQENGVHIPKRYSRIRSCQWNVHFFDGGGANTATAFVKALLETKSDIMVLNEFGTIESGGFDEPGQECALQLLKENGYQVHMTDGHFPTAICSSLEVLDFTTIELDIKRDAVGVQMRIDPASFVDENNDDVVASSHSERSNKGNSRRNNCYNNKQDSHIMWFYGILLED